MRLRNRSLGAGALAHLPLVGLALALLLAGGRAHAITVYFDGADGYGVGPALASQARAEGIPIIDPGGSLDFLPLQSDDPVNPFAVDLNDPFMPGTFSIPASPSRSDPVRAEDDWVLRNDGASRENFWMVFFSNSFRQALEGGPYDPSVVGLELTASEAWGLIRVRGSGPGEEDTFYPAFFAGRLVAGGATTVPVRYRVARSLLENSVGEPTVPRFLVGQATAPIPEPTTALLLGAGLMGLAAAGRRR